MTMEQGVNIGKKNNRTFYEIPYAKFIHMMFYKGEQEGIHVVLKAFTTKKTTLPMFARQ